MSEDKIPKEKERGGHNTPEEKDSAGSQLQRNKQAQQAHKDFLVSLENMLLHQEDFHYLLSQEIEDWQGPEKEKISYAVRSKLESHQKQMKAIQEAMQAYMNSLGAASKTLREKELKLTSKFPALASKENTPPEPEPALDSLPPKPKKVTAAAAVAASPLEETVPTTGATPDSVRPLREKQKTEAETSQPVAMAFTPPTKSKKKAYVLGSHEMEEALRQEKAAKKEAERKETENKEKQKRSGTETAQPFTPSSSKTAAPFVLRSKENHQES